MFSGVREKLIWGVGCLTACTGLYLVTNRLTDDFDDRAQMYFQWELDIPLIPGFILLYTSFYFLLLLGFWACKTRVDLQNLSVQMFVCAIIAAFVFVACPGELGYTRSEETGLFKPIYDLLFSLDKKTNLYPSLHIAFSYVATWCVLGQTRSVIFKLLFLIWFVGICCSVVLVHQHHLFDVMTGLALGMVARKIG
jgi:membrane-associated phospholipid phosphatase